MSKTQGANEIDKTKDQCMAELAKARRRIAELESSEVERQRVEEALRESEERYRSIVENIGIGITLIGQDHSVIIANDEQGKIFHKPASKLIGRKCFEEFEKRDAVCPHCPGVEAIATGRPATVETTGIRDNGSVNFARIRAFPVLDAEGIPTGFIEVVEDITDLKLAEKRRRESEERFRLLVEYAADAFFLHDSDSSILEVNQRACESLGYTREELLGLSVQDFDPGFNPSTALENWKKLVPGKPEGFEGVHVRKDGTTFPVEVRIGVFESGGQRFYLALVRDITDRKRAEAEVQKAYADVKRQVEEQTAKLRQEVAERERLQQEIIEAQKQALQELSTPIIPMMERIIVMPLIGGVDTSRARDITRALLAGIQQHKAKVVIIDITGVSIVDSGVANHLNKTIQAARLKGARTVVTGISDAVAETIVDLGIDWSGIETLSDLRTGLLVALNSQGIKLAK